MFATAQESILFIKRYRFGGREQLVDKLSAHDVTVLDEWAAADDAEVEEENIRIRQEQLAFCAQRGGKTAVELATRHARIFDEWGGRVLARNEQRVSRLSAPGKEAVSHFVAEFVTPRLDRKASGEVSGEIEQAKADPEVYLSHLDLVCHVLETGELPAEVQKAIDKKFPRTMKSNPGVMGRFDPRNPHIQ